MKNGTSDTNLDSLTTFYGRLTTVGTLSSSTFVSLPFVVVRMDQFGN